MKQKLLISISFILVSFLVYFIILQQRQHNFIFSNFGTSMPTTHHTLGIDVSHHQGKIDWNKALNMNISGDSIAFVYLKVSEGTNFKDPRYEENRRTLDRHPVKVGGYHFFSPRSSARAQAHFFIQNFKKTSLLPVLDLEVIAPLDQNTLIDSVQVFINVIHRQLGISPIIYTYESFYTDYIKGSALEAHHFWIAAYKPNCAICTQDNVILWQFSDQGTINGIHEKVDLNSAKTNFWEKALWP